MAPEIAYRERLSVAWWLWPAALAGSAFLATELAIGAFALRNPLTYVVAALLAVAGSAGAEPDPRSRSRPTSCGSTTPPAAVRDRRRSRVIDAGARRELLGQDADPLAFVIQRPWIPGGVRIDLDDPADPTPYWFVSSRHPADLAAALRTSGR